MPGLCSWAKGTAPTGEGAPSSVAAPGCLQSAEADSLRHQETFQEGVMALGCRKELGGSGMWERNP